MESVTSRQPALPPSVAVHQALLPAPVNGVARGTIAAAETQATPLPVPGQHVTVPEAAAPCGDTHHGNGTAVESLRSGPTTAPALAGTIAVPDAAAALGLVPGTLYGQVRRGVFRAVPDVTPKRLYVSEVEQAQRARYRKCVWCGQRYQARRASQQYCAGDCRQQRATRGRTERNRQARLAAQPPPETLSLPDAAGRLDLSVSRVRYYVGQGVLPPVPAWRPQRVRSADVEALRRQRQGPLETLTYREAGQRLGISPSRMGQVVRAAAWRTVPGAKPVRVYVEDVDRLCAAATRTCEWCETRFIRRRPARHYYCQPSCRAATRQRRRQRRPVARWAVLQEHGAALTERRAAARAALDERRAAEAGKGAQAFHKQRVYPCGPCYDRSRKEHRCVGSCALVQDQRRRMRTVPDDRPLLPAGDPAGWTEHDPAAPFLRAVSSYPLLTVAELLALALARDAGIEALRMLRRRRLPSALANELEVIADAGAVARRRMLESNLRLVVHWARRYRGKGLPLLDLIQEGNFGLDTAVTKFNPYTGYRFSTYATWHIRVQAARAIGQQGGHAIRTPVHVVERRRVLDLAQQELTGVLGRPPSYAELAAHTGLLEHQVESALETQRAVLSLDQAVGQADTDDRPVLVEAIADEAAVAPETAALDTGLAQDLDTLLAGLTPREQTVLRLRFGLSRSAPALSLADVGASVDGISRERVRQIEADALAKLRASPHLPKLAAYLA